MSTTSIPQRCAQVISIAATRKPDPQTPAALILLARYRAAWLRANPQATADEELAAGAEIAKELGL